MLVCISSSGIIIPNFSYCVIKENNNLFKFTYCSIELLLSRVALDEMSHNSLVYICLRQPTSLISKNWS